MLRFRYIILLLLSLALASSTLANSALLAADEAIANLRWKSGAIKLAISASLLRENPNIKKDSDVAGAIERSIEAWSRAANIDIVHSNSDKMNASPAGAAGDGVSLITIAPTAENVLLFAKDPENAAATTRVFYNWRGMITEADIVLNPYQQFSTDGTLGTFDLESTLTHEIGHLLGLSHSLVLGSTMHANYGKNGVFGLQSVSSRTLAADDIAEVRALYGARESEDCCGIIEGKLAISGKHSRNIQVWIEDTAGRVHGGSKAAADGAFRFAGLVDGKYRVFAQEVSRSRIAMPAQEIGEASVSGGDSTTLNAKAATGPRDFELTYLGFNGQLSEMAVSLSPSRSYVLYFGGRNLDPKKLSVSFTSPHLSVVPGTLRAHDYGDEISVVSVEVRVGSRALRGEYSIYLELERGDRQAIIGGLTIDNFNGPRATFAVFDD